MMLGCVLEQAFKDEYPVTLVRAPEVPGTCFAVANLLFLKVDQLYIGTHVEGSLIKGLLNLCISKALVI